MKKFYSIFAALMLMATAASAQTFSVGSNVATVDVGFGGGYGIPFSVQYERGIYEIQDDMTIGVGANLSLGFDSGAYIKWTHTFINLLANYHYTAFDKWDLYGGVGLGYYHLKAKDTAPNMGFDMSYSDGAFAWTVQAGARYYFNETWAVHAEAGYGIANFKVGASYKF